MKRIYRFNETTVYHCLSRTVHGEKWLNARAKDVFCRSLHKVAAFCGVRILTYCVMSNHFHLLIEVPAQHLRESIPDAELVRRFRLMYGENGTTYMPISANKLDAIFKAGEKDADGWRKLLRERMHDLPMFMKLLKQRFTQWYNVTHETYGTFWASRYTSLLVESDNEILRKIACYIDLNPVRAQLVEDPSSYRWSGYGAAVSGSNTMRKSLAYMNLTSNNGVIEKAFRDYEQELYQRGAFPLGQPGKNGVIPAAIVERVLVKKSSAVTFVHFSKKFSAWLHNGYIVGSNSFVKKNSTWIAMLIGRKSEGTMVSDAQLKLYCLNRNLRE
jgi:putative transposase